ncbi:hypothetical protein [Amycolatopsis mediterranei]|uniref:Uncharacterized protein n=1 Tax=Amycolatopsis mediterranei (strain S699) TaxID=713604 RepID=A0A9R0UD27_AMYMS|nr:hypothetical protein [Amycolatopsis mediterranei]AEK46529.1 hypothetical protein RAM_40310 [Amycolatopsis mediterranei S699]UZF74563.1 hypothetical protein ISP_008087 [Amycolatopsis mediterranei]
MVRRLTAAGEEAVATIEEFTARLPAIPGQDEFRGTSKAVGKPAHSEW